jgi:uncharacterized BrkB/YihY/UPF0761 family membrane protein
MKARTVVMSFGSFVMEPRWGCVFVIPAYWMALVVVLPILIVRRFGVGAAVFLPFFVLGLPLTYTFEYLGNGNLRSVWGVLAWCLVGPVTGLCADLVFRFAPRSTPDRWRAIITGAVFGAAVFVTTYLALTYLYVNPSAESHYGYFTVGIGFSLPWLVVNGGLASYTAFAISRRA